MTSVEIDLSRFDYGSETIMKELYMETPIIAPSNDDFFNLPLNDEYKNNTVRIERTKKLNEEKNNLTISVGNEKQQEQNIIIPNRITYDA